MIACIKGHSHVNIVQSVIMTYVVLLQGLGIQNHNLHDHIHEIAYSMTLSPQKSQCNSSLRYSLKERGATHPLPGSGASSSTPVEGHQGVVLVGVYQLVMIHHIVDHHSPEIPIGKIGIVPIYGMCAQPCFSCWPETDSCLSHQPEITKHCITNETTKVTTKND